MHVAVKRDDHDLKQVIDLNTMEIAIPRDPHKHGSSLQILLWLYPPSPDPVVIGTHPHLIEAGTFQVCFDLLRG
jgi:hypothetical protein